MAKESRRFGRSRVIGWGIAVLFGASLAAAESAAVEKAKKDPGEPDANHKVAGNAAPNHLILGLVETPVVQGAQPVENGSAGIPFYGYDANGPMVPAPGDVQSTGHNVEASKTEPDKNTYLVLERQVGPDGNYDYGRRFLFQGHETGVQGYITRVNLDADAAHRVTLWASEDENGAALPVFDGSTWNPFAQRLLFTSEKGADGGVWSSTIDFPPTVEDVSGTFGRAGYEGIQNDSDGNVWIVEDTSGAAGTINSHAKQPNSFLYRFVPKNPRDLSKGGRLQALRVYSVATGLPIVFHPGQADADILSAAVGELHTFGKHFPTLWVTIHDTDVDGTSPFDANALAKAAGATPLKRPENGQFRPGSGFTQFFFDETGDTNLSTEAGAAFGGFGAILRLTQSSPSADHGTLMLFYRGDPLHTGLDNCAFWDENHVVFVEDAGDGLHTSRNAFDSAYLFDVRVDYSNPADHPLRLLALGRDASATIDSALSANSLANGFQNEGDNEITGFHVSDGDAGIHGILGAKNPHPFRSGWRVFYTQQHGDNFTWEILRSGSGPLDLGSDGEEN